MSEQTTTAYDEQFYDQQKDGSYQTAKTMVPVILQTLAPIRTIRSVVDIGCGLGTWLSAYRQNGIVDIAGVDGSYVKRDKLYIDANDFYEADLEKPLMLGKRFDLVQSLEVAEHLSAESSQVFVDSLCRHGDLIVFSAAIPGQGGTNHINEQYPSYWAALFARHDYIYCDCIRNKVWANAGIVLCYQQNILLFVKRSLADLAHVHTLFDPPIDVIHPYVLLQYQKLILQLLHEKAALTNDIQRLTNEKDELTKTLVVYDNCYASSNSFTKTAFDLLGIQQHHL